MQRWCPYYHGGVWCRIVNPLSYVVAWISPSHWRAGILEFNRQKHRNSKNKHRFRSVHNLTTQVIIETLTMTIKLHISSSVQKENQIYPYKQSQIILIQIHDRLVTAQGRNLVPTKSRRCPLSFRRPPESSGTQPKETNPMM